ncbi:uncharacterized protein LOC119577702 [Penaeus monodon]|uniref:uncharacterized protein LOC119577702 n=1 Tax=Penaeus monodon TaxID=6687 RepID=UPI0018A7A625|nr:uncharacterized protein LOC119577702 [Penaeus monodon]
MYLRAYSRSVAQPDVLPGALLNVLYIRSGGQSFRLKNARSSCLSCTSYSRIVPTATLLSSVVRQSWALGVGRAKIVALVRAVLAAEKALSNYAEQGCQVSSAGVEPDPEKISSIAEMPAPKSVKDICHFLDSTGFFRWHIKNYVKIAAPLTCLTHKDNFDQHFEIHTDASGVAIGACLMQGDDNAHLHPVAYFSQKLRDAELRYPAIDAKALEAVRPFDSYRQGTLHCVPNQLRRDVAAISLQDIKPQTLRLQQLEDPFCKVIFYLEKEKLPQHCLPLYLDEFEMKVHHIPDQVLHHLVVPKALCSATLRLAHSILTAAHQGIYHTYCKLHDLFYFPNMLCTNDAKGTAYRVPLTAGPQLTLSLEKVSADLELDTTTEGNNKDAPTVTEAFLRHFVTLFGPPKLLQTVIGTEFKNVLFSKVCELLSIKTSYTTIFHPQANGIVERSNIVVKNTVATLLEIFPHEWDELLPYVRIAVSVHMYTGIQPLYLLMGHHGNTNYMEEDPKSVGAYVHIAAETSTQAHEKLQ